MAPPLLGGACMDVALNMHAREQCHVISIQNSNLSAVLSGKGSRIQVLHSIGCVSVSQDKLATSVQDDEQLQQHVWSAPSTTATWCDAVRVTTEHSGHTQQDKDQQTQQ